MKYPLLFSLEGKIPLFVYNRMVKRYFFNQGIAEKDLQWRLNKGKELPRSERWLLWFFKPVFKIYEMRIRPA
jgi:hypothetical protein